MKRLILTALAVVFVFPACAQGGGASKDAFMGSWVSIADDGDVRELAITGSTFTITYTPVKKMVWSPFTERFEANPETRLVYEIFSWEAQANENPDTKAAFPRGFLLGLRGGIVNDTAALYMGRDGRGLSMADIVFTRPLPEMSQSDFYGTWVYEGTSYGSDYKITVVITANSFNEISGETTDDLSIISWEKTTNDDPDTMRNYPSGFAITLKSPDNEEGVVKLFIHRNRGSCNLINNVSSNIHLVRQSN